MFKNYTMEQVEARLAEINEELRSNPQTADLDKLTEEVEKLEARKAEIKDAAEKRSKLLASVASAQGSPVVTEKKSRDLEEIRSSKEYIKAFATYVRTKDDTEVRSLLTENATNGTVPVPTFVEGIVKTAWERDSITRLVKKTYLKGNLKQGFEISGTGATTRTEGSTTVSEETLVTGIVEIKAQEIMKWVSISREVYALADEEFLRYIYDELTYRIAKELAKTLINKIEACTTVATTTQVSVGIVTATQAGVGIVAEALAELSDAAVNPVVAINKKSWGALKQAQYANKFNVDPFEGLPVVFNNDIKALSAATTGEAWMIVGDFGNGSLANLPKGDNVDFLFDELTSASSGMVKVYGSEMAGIEPVAPLAFCKVVK